MLRHRGAAVGWLSMTVAYLAISAILLHPVLATLRHGTVWPENDPSLAIWSDGWVAHAVAHLHNPFFSHAVAAPRGLNLLANTTETGLALVFVPVTWLLGPIAAFNLQLLVVPVLGALAMALCLQPWTTSWWSRFLGGLLWGFCPFALASEVWGLTQFVYLVTPPLVVWLLADLWRFHRLPTRRVGLGLGCVVSFQVLVGVELLAICAIAGLVVVVVLGAAMVLRHRDRLATLARRTSAATAWSMIPIGLVGLPAALYATVGPGHLASWVYDPIIFESFSVPWRAFVSGAAETTSFTPYWHPDYPSVVYLGPVLVVVLAVVLAWRWRHPMARTFGGLALVGLWLARGPSALGDPWQLLWHLPEVHNIFEPRCIVITWLGAAGLVGLGTDALLARARTTPASRWRQIAAGAVPLLALAQLAVAVVPATGIVSESVVPDLALDHLHPVAGRAPIVLAFPTPNAGRSIVQQAEGDFSYDLVGAYGPQVAEFTPAERTADRALLKLAWGSFEPPLPALRAIGTAVQQWGVDEVVVPIHLGYPLVRGYVEPYRVVAALTLVLGPPLARDGDWVWARPREVATLRELPAASWHRCVVRIGRHHPREVPSCVTAAIAPASTGRTARLR